jgi:hypothetical protein
MTDCSNKANYEKSDHEKCYLEKSDLEKMVDFCDKIIDRPQLKGKVVHETDCISIKYPHIDVDCHCFRHKSYVVHGKWFWE